MRTDAALKLPPVIRLGPIETAAPPAAYSLSGNERNCLFVSGADGGFTDVSGISGLDHPADGRALAVLDYDRDGWNDLAVVNANAPLFQLFHNELGAALGDRTAIGLRLVGDNRSAEPCTSCSPRDGIGARVELDVDGVTLIRELHAGEGLAGQNSRTSTIGLGHAGEARVRVRWPSGARRDYGVLKAGAIYSLREDGDAAVRVSSFASAARPAPTQGESGGAESLGSDLPSPPDGARIRVLTTMATWCAACATQLPRLARLSSRFGKQIAIYGVPVDEGDTPAMLAAYVAKRRPSYRLLDRSETAESIRRVEELVRARLHQDALPASVLLDASGAVLAVVPGAPSVSDVARQLARRES